MDRRSSDISDSFYPRSMPTFPPVRHRRLQLRALFAATLLVTSVTACSDNDDATAPSSRPASVVVTPRVTALRIGQTQQLAAEARDAADAVLSGRSVTWRSIDPAVASVNEAGLVTMLTDGSTAIVAIIDGVNGAAAFQGVAPVASVSIGNVERALPLGESRQLSVTTLDARGNPLIARATTLTSSNPAVATISASGVVSGIASGTTTITATSEGRSGTATVRVQRIEPVGTIVVSPSGASVSVGGTRQLTTEVKDVTGEVVTDRIVTWSSSSAATGTVSSTGLVTVVTPGTFTVTATSEGRTATSTINELLPDTDFTVGGPVNSTYTYLLTVPAGATGITVTLVGAGSQDPDLIVFRPGSTTAACSSERAGPNETCTFTSMLTAGTWRVQVVGFTAYSGVTLRAVITRP